MANQRNRFQFQALFREVLAHKTLARNVASIAAGAEAVETFTVPGAALGDHVLSFAFGVSLAGLNANAYVSATDTVSIQLGNATAGAIDLASTDVTIVVGKPDPNVFTS